MTAIKELALRIGAEVWPDTVRNINDCEEFATRFLAAYLAEQEPVAYLYQLIVEDQVVNQQGSTINWNPDYHPFGRKGIDYSASGTVIKQPLFTAPPEPEPQQDKQEAGDYGLTGSSAVCAALPADEIERSKT